MPFDSQEELTIENIKHSCEKYFSSRVGPNLICDVLAGEQGPSCKTVDQIPSLKVIHVRFINRLSVIDDTDDVSQYDSETSDNFDKASSSHEPPKNRHVMDKPKSECQLPKTTGWSKKKIENSSPAKSMYPVSLSVIEMIKLGKFNKATSSSSTVVMTLKALGGQNSLLWLNFQKKKNLLLKEVFERPLRPPRNTQCILESGLSRDTSLILFKKFKILVRLLRSIQERPYKCICWLEIFHYNWNKK